jgi:phosphomannomutase
LTSRFVSEEIERNSAKAVKTKVGHSLIKDKMAETGAIFGGEHSAHYYFRDFWGADNGMLAAMHVISELGGGSSPMSVLSSKTTPYFASGEINSTVTDRPAALQRVREVLGAQSEEEFDGTTFSGSTTAGWC